MGLVSKVISTLIGAKSTLTLIITLVTKSHDPLSMTIPFTVGGGINQSRPTLLRPVSHEVTKSDPNPARAFQPTLSACNIMFLPFDSKPIGEVHEYRT